MMTNSNNFRHQGATEITDRKLLELAAKAAGFKLEQGYGQPPEKCLFYCNDDGCHDWDPFNDDGDALRLAVNLLFEIDMGRGCIAIRHSTGIRILEAFNHDPYAATRRAIVCAAAEIGKQIK